MSNEDKAFLKYFLDTLYDLVDGGDVQGHIDVHRVLILKELFGRFTEDDIVLFVYRCYGAYDAATILPEIESYARQLNDRRSDEQ